MKTINSISAILILLVIPGSAIRAQETKIISGRITTFGVIPLNNVKITTSKSKTVAYSDDSGLFSITCLEKDIVKVSAAGFDTKRFKAKKIDSLNVDLVYSNNENSYNKATGNGHINENILKDAMTKYPLKGEEDYSRYSTIYELISNEISKVSVNGTTITTKMPTSFFSSQEVLCVVNGTIIDNISFITPADVKSIRYVDGPEAGQYGFQGANGIIEITLR